MAHLGDFVLETTIYAKFCTVTTTGAPTVLAGTPVVSVYENDDNTQITAWRPQRTGTRLGSSMMP